MLTDSKADTIRTLLRARMSESEVMAALGVEREYVRLVKMRPSRKHTVCRFDRKVAGSDRGSRTS